MPDLATRARDARRRLDATLADLGRATDEAERREQQYANALAAVDRTAVITPEPDRGAETAHARLVDANSEAQRLRDQVRELVPEVERLERLAGAPAAHAAAVETLRKARTGTAEAAARLDRAHSRVTRAKVAREQAAAAAEQARTALRQTLAASLDADQPPAVPASSHHAEAVAALDEVVAAEVEAATAIERELQALAAAERDAEQRARETFATVREAEAEDALDAFLPHWVAYVAARAAANLPAPELDLDERIAPDLDAAVQRAQADVLAGSQPGAVRRAVRAVAAALGG
jgi:DNA repair exonuclease SbcCD ATPase subunit